MPSVEVDARWRRRRTRGRARATVVMASCQQDGRRLSNRVDRAAVRRAHHGKWDPWGNVCILSVTWSSL